MTDRARLAIGAEAAREPINKADLIGFDEAIRVPRSRQQHKPARLLGFDEAVAERSRLPRKEIKTSEEGSSSNLYDNNVTIFGLEPDKSKRIFSLKRDYGYNDKQAEEADRDLTTRFAKFSAAQMPERPVREYIPRQDNIIDYLKADDGFGPWWQMGQLTRPLIREKSPRAYMALSNWLRSNELPADIPIPTKSEIIDRRAEGIADSDSDAIRAARALYERQRYVSRKR